ncbi:MAG: hypothetical protein KJN85_05315 [Maribacter sp.]|nr:hypothetical protein [Maribacter sp.]
MKLRSILTNKIRTTTGALILAALFILWEYLNGGVHTHYLLARKDLPGISNWWGLLTIPALTWLVLTLIQRRQSNEKRLQPNPENDETDILKRFLGSLAFGILLSILWEFRVEDLLQYLIFLPVIIALFRPVHLPECLLGFVLGMLFTFGGILPILVGTVLLVFSWIANKLIRKGILFIASKFN